MSLEALALWSERVPLLMSLVSVGFVAVEWVALARLDPSVRHREGAVSVGSALLSFLPVFALQSVVLVSAMFWLWDHRLVDLGRSWWVWGLAYVAYDLANYVLHRLQHRVRLLWCIHEVHHSARELKASVSFRGSFADVLVAPHLTLWLPLLGFHPLMVVIVEGVALLYGVPLHVSERFAPTWGPRWLRAVFMTPRGHRLHHAANAPYLDTNYALTFSLWDRLFGSWQAPVAGIAPRYGLVREVDDEGLVASQTDAWRLLWADVRSAPGWADKVRYLVMPPGWAPYSPPPVGLCHSGASGAGSPMASSQPPVS